jgi:parallel beta-helix repeat protein
VSSPLRRDCQLLFVLSALNLPQRSVRSLSGLLLCLVGFGLLDLSGAGRAIAQIKPSQASPAKSNQPNFVFVNTTVGNDGNSGTEQTPLRTITRALQVAPANTIIVLAPGTYSTASGETFPLQLKTGTTIQGDPRNRGQNVIIRGGGWFLSRTFARQNVTLLGANRAGLTGVTVSNPSPQGYGLWVESTNPIVVDSTFTGSDHDGVSVVGNSAPILRNNYFYQNGANGITIYGTSRPVLQENIFERTGFGINIAQNAAPRLISNRVTQNKDGIVVQGNAQPVLRNNVIDGNERDGLVAIAQSRPDLGTTAEPGNNIFQDNRQFDINAQVNRQMLPAFGNQLNTAQTVGKIDFSGTVVLPTVMAATGGSGESAPSPPLIPRPLPQSATARPISMSSPAIVIPVASPVTSQPVIAQSPPVSQRDIVFSRPDVARVQLQPRGDVQVPTQPAIPTVGLPMINSVRRLPAPAPRSRDITVATERSGVPIPVPSVSTGFPNRSSGSTPTSPSGELLPVPGPNAPIGNAGDTPSVTVWRNRGQQTAGAPPIPPNRLTGLGLRYRVVVDADSEADQSQVRAIAPQAFFTTLRGRSVMQAGAFSDRTKADQLLEMLNSQGLRATLESL